MRQRSSYEMEHNPIVIQLLPGDGSKSFHKGKDGKIFSRVIQHIGLTDSGIKVYYYGRDHDHFQNNALYYEDKDGNQFGE